MQKSAKSRIISRHQSNLDMRKIKIASSMLTSLTNRIGSNVLNRLGNRLKRQGDLEGAIESYRAALQFKSEAPEAHYNLGAALLEQGNFNEALDCFETTVKLDHYIPEAHMGIACVKLLHGNFKEGWEKYEWRLRRGQNSSNAHASPNCALWNGEPITDKTKLLLITEQGLGDTLQFMRYVLTLKQQGINISLCAQPKLHSLIRASGIDDTPLTPDQANQVNEGQWMPLLSLPKYLNITPDNPLITEPYIQSTDELNSKWKDILSSERRPIIGINWQGNPEAETAGLKGRSLPLEKFEPIIAQTNATLLSLQKGIGMEQLNNCSFKQRFVNCQDQINETWDFLETAAIINNCDLIITSDTAVAHLAGGMGKPTWLLLQKVPDWRWGLGNDTTFWYRSLRLFRQHENRNWDEVMQRVAHIYQEKFEKKSESKRSMEITLSKKEEISNHDPIISLQEYRQSIFQAHTVYALDKYLNPLWQKLSKNNNTESLKSLRSKDKKIIIVDDRPTKLLRFCVLNSLAMTGFKYVCIVYTSAASSDAIKTLFEDVKDFVEIIELSDFGISKLSRDTYNQLLKREQFWKIIPAKNILLSQTDALLIEPLPEVYFQYDYIGAPWSPNKILSISFPEYAKGELVKRGEIWKNCIMNPNHNIPIRVGNGGHSIRSINYMKAISSTQESTNSEPEDIFYAKNSHNYPGLFPTLAEAKKFCCETSYSFSYGAHASHLYLEYHYQAEIYERHVKNLIGQCDAYDI